MDRPIWVRLLAVLERNPESTTVTLNRASAEEMLHEIKRLRAGGCARDQGLTQYCAEAAAKDAEITALKAEVERLRAALELWMDAVRIDATMEGPRYMGVSSTLGRKAWEATLAAITGGEKSNG